LILDDGVVVQLPDAGWQKQLDTLEHLIVDNSILERNLIEIDLRSPTKYFFILKNGQEFLFLLVREIQPLAHSLQALFR